MALQPKAGQTQKQKTEPLGESGPKALQPKAGQTRKTEPLGASGQKALQPKAGRTRVSGHRMALQPKVGQTHKTEPQGRKRGDRQKLTRPTALQLRAGRAENYCTSGLQMALQH